MAIEPLISWSAPEHLYVEKHTDWYWTVGIITLALAAVAFIFGQVITGILILVAALALTLHASRPPATCPQCGIRLDWRRWSNART